MAKIDGSILQGYEMQDKGDAAAAVAMDGFYELKLISGKLGDAQSGNRSLRLGFSVVAANDSASEKAEEGKPVFWSNAISGLVKGGFNEGFANVKNLHHILTSAGRQDLVKAIGGVFDDEEVLAALLKGNDGTKNVRLYARLEQKDDNGRVYSDVKYFIRKEKYEDHRTNGTNFRVSPSVGAATQRPAGRPQTSTKPNGAAGSAPVASDALSAEV